MSDEPLTPQDTGEEEFRDLATLGRHHTQQIWSVDDLGFDLTLEQQLFVRSYLIDRNGIAAVIRLGYQGERQQLKRAADRFLSSTVVQDAIKEGAQRLMDRLEVTADRVNRDIASIAFTNVGDLVHFDGVTTRILPSQFWPEHAKVAVKALKVGQFGVTVEFHDKQKALDFLAKQTGLAETEEQADQRRAEAAAEAALIKIMDVVTRNREIKQARVISQDGVQVEDGHK